MSQTGIFESVEAAAGKNGRGLNIPSERQEAVLWVVQRLSKLTNERLMTAQQIRDVRRAAKNDGYAAETINVAKKLARMSPEQRTEYQSRMQKALSLYGFSVDVIESDPKPDKLLADHLQKLRVFEQDRREMNAEIVEVYAAAKDSGIDTLALKEIIRLSRLDPEERTERYHRLDNLGTILGYW